MFQYRHQPSAYVIQQQQLAIENKPIQELTLQFPVSSGTKHHTVEQIENEAAVVPMDTALKDMALVPFGVSVQSAQPVIKSETEQDFDVSSLVTKRLDAVKRINTNPNDFEAYMELQRADEQV